MRTNDEIMELLRGDSYLNKARAKFSGAAANIDQKSVQGMSPVEMRGLEFEAVEKIVAAYIPLKEFEPILDRYQAMIWSTGITAPMQEPEGKSFNHLLWMIEEMRTMTDPGKWMRWLGFVQGMLISHGLTTVREERDFTRPFFKK